MAEDLLNIEVNELDTAIEIEESEASTIEAEEEILNIENEEDVEESMPVDVLEKSVTTVEIEVLEPTVITMEEMPAAYNKNAITHESLLDRNNAAQHTMSSIENLIPSLTELASAKEEYSVNGGFAEFIKWQKEAKGIGYFVQLINDNGTLVMDVCTGSNVGVYGVTVDHSGFCGNQSPYYDHLGLTDKEGNRWNIATDDSYDRVCLIGCVKVRTTKDNINVGDFVVPGDGGYAVKSENNVGYKVVAKGAYEFVEGDARPYVEIILTPQNESIDRIAEAITEAQGGVTNLQASFGDLMGQMGTMNDVVISIGKGFDDLKEDVDKALTGENGLLDTAQKAVEKAEGVAEQAKTAIQNATEAYRQAVTDMKAAKESVRVANEDLGKLEQILTPLATWGSYICVLPKDVAKNTACYFTIGDNIYGFTMPINIKKNTAIKYDATVEPPVMIVGDEKVGVVILKDEEIANRTLIETFKPDGDHSIAGFVAQANKDSTTLASMTSAFGPDGTDITAIMQKIDSNGGAIEMVVSHVDKYSLGPKSPTDGLTLAETSIMKLGHIYVPTESHWEFASLYKYTLDRSIEQNTVFSFDIDVYDSGSKVPIATQTLTRVAPIGFSAGAIVEYLDGNLTIDDILCKPPSDDFNGETINLDKLRPEYEPIYFQDYDSINLKSCQSYEWAWNQDTHVYEWQEYADVIIEDEYKRVMAVKDNRLASGSTKDILWYCTERVITGEKTVLYTEGTLYLWDGKWIAVARVGDNDNSRTIGVIRQTAEKLTSTYADAASNMSTIQQDAKAIKASVKDVEGNLSQIEETAKKIRMGVYNPEKGSSSLEVLLGGLSSTAINVTPEIVQSYEGKGPSPLGGAKYTEPPIWNNTKFEFAEDTRNDIFGVYYFESKTNESGKETGVKTYYCEDVVRNGNTPGYNVYAVSSISLASLNTRVTDAEATLESFTNFNTDLTETITSVIQTSDAERAEISSTVLGKFQKRVDIELKPTDEMINALQNATKYSEAPKINGGAFVFKTEPTTDGKYCQLNDDTATYYKILYNGEEIIGYEKYEIASSGYASILEKVDATTGSSLGLVVGATDEDASGILIQSVNGNSTAYINADKIGIDGTAVFRDNMRDGTTTISGNYVKTGVLVSENYDGPVTYVQYGLDIEETTDENGNKVHKLVKANSDEICIRYSPIVTTTIYELTPSEGVYYHAVQIAVDAELIDFALTNGKFEASGYVISKEDFDLIPQNGTANHITTGTKFDLNVGTIYSKNFTLDRNGDLTIAGRITATSGYLGDKDSGFNIGRNVIYNVGADGLEVGKYYFKVDEKYYQFELTSKLYNGEQIVFCENDKNIYINNEYFCPTNQSGSVSNDIVGLVSTDILNYSLSNNQYSLWGDRSRDKNGVYISPDGIGLGNGTFGIQSDGTLQTLGAVEIYDIENKEWFFQADPKTSTLRLRGNIVLGGSITWDASSNPLKVLYAATSGTPTHADWEKATDNDDTTTTKWHTTWDEDNDNYAAYSYDGGKTWTNAIQIRGKDGENGAPGGSANVDKESIFNMLTNNGKQQGIFPFYRENPYDSSSSDTQLFINAEYIQTGTLSGIQIISKQAGKNIVDIHEGRIHFKTTSNSNPKLRIGYASQAVDYAPYIMMGEGTTGTTTWIENIPFAVGATTMYKYTDGFHMTFKGSDDKTHGIHFYDANSVLGSGSHIGFGNSIVDFTNTTVKGLKVTFG